MTAFRTDAEFLARIDAHTKRLQALAPFTRVTRTDAIRALLVDALDRAEGAGRRKAR